MPIHTKEYLLYNLTHTVVYSYGCHHKVNKQIEAVTINNLATFLQIFQKMFSRSQLAASASFHSKFRSVFVNKGFLLIGYLDYCPQFIFLYLCSWGNFYGKPLAADSLNWLPAPLECSLADAKNAVTVENNRN